MDKIIRIGLALLLVTVLSSCENLRDDLDECIYSEECNEYKTKDSSDFLEYQYDNTDEELNDLELYYEYDVNSGKRYFLYSVQVNDDITVEDYLYYESLFTKLNESTLKYYSNLKDGDGIESDLIIYFNDITLHSYFDQNRLMFLISVNGNFIDGFTEYIDLLNSISETFTRDNLRIYINDSLNENTTIYIDYYLIMYGNSLDVLEIDIEGAETISTEQLESIKEFFIDAYEEFNVIFSFSSN